MFLLSKKQAASRNCAGRGIDLNRRGFIGGIAGFSLALGGIAVIGRNSSCKKAEEESGCSRQTSIETAPKTPEVASGECDIVAVRGNNARIQLRTAIEELGGAERFGFKGKRILIKPNCAFANNPSLATTTSPELVGEMVKMCFENGAASVLVFDHLLTDIPEKTLEVNGIGKAAAEAGADIKAYAASRPGPSCRIEIEGAEAMPHIDVLNEVLEADFIINMPKAKHHSATVLTLSMKNLIGVLGDMGRMHSGDIHKAIGELNTVIRPGINVLDAMSILINNGPGGPGDIEYPNEIVAGVDPVAVDSYASSLFGKQPRDIPSLKHAEALGVGTLDYESCGFRRMKV